MRESNTYNKTRLNVRREPRKANSTTKLVSRRDPPLKRLEALKAAFVHVNHGPSDVAGSRESHVGSGDPGRALVWLGDCYQVWRGCAFPGRSQYGDCGWVCWIRHRDRRCHRVLLNLVESELFQEFAHRRCLLFSRWIACYGWSLAQSSANIKEIPIFFLLTILKRF